MLSLSIDTHLIRLQVTGSKIGSVRNNVYFSVSGVIVSFRIF